MAKQDDTYQMTVQASTKHLAKVRNFVAHHAAAFGLDQEKVDDIRLAVDEAYTNIIKHAYKSNSNSSVEIRLGYNNAKFWVTLQDTGRAFNPDTYQKPNIRRRIKQKKRGGIGVYLIRELMDKVEYSTKDAINSIRMTKIK